MHACSLIALLLLVVAAGISAYERAFTFALLAAGLAFWVAPVALQLHS